MNKEKYKEIVKKNEPKKHRIRNASLAFLCGGTIGLLAESFYLIAFRLLEFSKEDSMLISTLSILFLASMLTAFSLFNKVAHFGGAGLFIPTTGFANSVVASAIDAKFEGPIYGVGSRMFSLAGSVLTYGFVGAFLYALIRLILSYMGVPIL